MSVTRETVELARARVGTMLKDKWRLDALLGAGGTACVYAATHRNGKRVAIKILHPEMSAVASVVTRFLREGYLANRVGHPGAVAVMDDDRADDGAVFIVMELLEGHSLERYAKAGREKLPRSTVLRLMDETLDVLAAAHAKGIVHRDIKPANLFLTLEGHVKVLDFGIARIAEPLGDAPLTQTGFSIGTPSFMPPEQARGRWEMVDARTDVWAVGATMYALLSGDRPRHGETTQEEMLLAMTQPLAPILSVVPDLAPGIAALVDRAVAYDRDGRWPDAVAMRQAVSAQLHDSTQVDGVPPLPSLGDARAVPDPGFPAPTMAVPAGALTTGRALSSPALPTTPAGSPTRLGFVFGGAAVATLVAIGAAGLVLSRKTPLPATPPTTTTTAVATANATTAPAASTTSPATTTSSPMTVPPEAGVTPAAGASATSSSRTPARTAPVAPRANTPNPFDQRF